MKNTNLDIINEKLADLSKQYTKLYPEFYVVELQYMQAKAQKLLSQEVSVLASQPLREAQCELLMSKTEVYKKYHSLYPEIEVIKKQMWIYQSISSNMRSQSFGETQ